MTEEQFDDAFEVQDETLAEEAAPFDFEDEFDRLRQKTARTSAVFDEMEMEEELEYEEQRGFFARISPGQRLVLLLLLLIDIVVIAVGVMVIFNVI